MTIESFSRDIGHVRNDAAKQDPPFPAVAVGNFRPKETATKVSAYFIGEGRIGGWAMGPAHEEEETVERAERNLELFLETYSVAAAISQEAMDDLKAKYQLIIVRVYADLEGRVGMNGPDLELY